jgi:CxxC motif-containing protein (DUF1111 family)
MKVSVKIVTALSAVMLVGVLAKAGGQTPISDSTASAAAVPSGAAPAPAGFDNQTNGFVTQSMMDTAKSEFQSVETPAEGLGPLFNATSCADCHTNPVIGAGSQISELRAASYDGTKYLDHPGGSLINDRALDPSIQETAYETDNVQTFRNSTSTLGDGFVEAISDDTLVAISNNQPSVMRGQVIRVPVLEAGGALRVGRFGWKNQHASLESFAADAYLNEMGITSPLFPTENTSSGDSVASFDKVPDPEDNGSDVRLFAQFMRSLKVPPRDDRSAATADAQAGSLLFSSIGCAVCHVRQIVTAPSGTSINGGALVVPPALGNKIIHPFGDFLLHDIGTGDGIVQNGGSSTMNKIRTAPLWGLRTRTRLMHDGASISPGDAILRHKGEALGVASLFRLLPAAQKNQLIAFLNSL